MSCRRYLESELGTTRLRVVLALGTIAHGSVLSALKLRKSHYGFAHGARHQLPSGLVLADSYHCSRYNTNTGRLTESMFDSVFESILKRLSQ